MTNLDQSQLNHLRRFIQKGDKNYPPIFVGREKIINDIKSISEIIIDEKHAAATRIIHGAPGSGKSSLLTHFCKTWKGIGDRKRPNPLVLYLPDPVDFLDIRSFGNALLKCVSSGESYTLSTSYSNSRDIGGGGNLSIPGLGSVGADGRYSVTHHHTVPDPIQAVMEHAAVRDKWNRSVVIAIDEFQNMPGDFDPDTQTVSDPHVWLLQKLHFGSYDKPIMLVCAGLCKTLQRLDGLGISGPDIEGVHALGCFSPQETKKLLSQWAKEFAVPDGAWKDTIFEIAQSGSHWPVHVQNSLMSLAEEMVAKKGVISDVELKVVEERSRFRREQYYGMRIDGPLKQSEFLLWEVMKAVPSIAGRGPKTKIRDVMNIVAQITGSPPDEHIGWRLPKSIDVDEFCLHLLKRGCIQQKDLLGHIECPVPSLKTYIQEHHAPSSQHELLDRG